jgi:hypothetical protein
VNIHYFDFQIVSCFEPCPHVIILCHALLGFSRVVSVYFGHHRGRHAAQSGLPEGDSVAGAL